MRSIAVSLVAAPLALSLLTCSHPRRMAPVGPSRSDEAETTVIDLPLARSLHLRGVDGDDDAAIRAQQMLRMLQAEQPDDPHVIAYTGSALLLEARRTAGFVRKGELCKEGLRLLEDAVKRAPDDLEVRAVRGISAYHLPFFFGRGKAARVDIADVAAAAEAAVKDGVLRRDVASAALFHQGLILEKDAEKAREAWRLAVDFAPESSYGRKAREKLAP